MGLVHCCGTTDDLYLVMILNTRTCILLQLYIYALPNSLHMHIQLPYVCRYNNLHKSIETGNEATSTLNPHNGT